MRATSWSTTTDLSEACRRAGGRRRYNSLRQLLAIDRRRRVVEILEREGWCGVEWGIRSRIAAQLGVSRATICRDFQFFEREMQVEGFGEEWLSFSRWYRRHVGQSLGLNPGTRWPDMNRRGCRRE